MRVCQFICLVWGLRRVGKGALRILLRVMRGGVEVEGRVGLGWRNLRVGWMRS